MKHSLRFYEKIGGGCQVREYLRGQGKKTRIEAGWLLMRLEEEGSLLRRPAAGHLRDGIFELRVVVERNQHRILYFFHGDTIVVTNAFLKKSARIPEAEIDRAARARADWLGREGVP